MSLFKKFSAWFAAVGMIAAILPMGVFAEDIVTPGAGGGGTGSSSIVEDFESHTAFAVNSPGSLGWSYIDGDNSTVSGLDGVTIPNLGSDAKLAYLVMKPEAATPAITEEGLLPKSGSQYLAAFPVTEGKNNDYLISPKLIAEEEYSFSFWAKSASAEKPEQMKVGYSTAEAKAADFTNWLTGENPVTVAAEEWTLYSYTVPKEAKYVTINCVSEGGTMFMVDDINFSNVELDQEKFEIEVGSGIKNGTLTTDKTEAAAGETVTVTVTPASGYQLVKDSLKYNSTIIQPDSENAYTFVMPEEAVTLTAQFEIARYKITYHLNGGKLSEDAPDSYTANDKITLETPTRAGYDFVGWYDAETGGNKVTQIPRGSEGDVAFWARWNSDGSIVLELPEVRNTPVTVTVTGHDEAFLTSDEMELVEAGDATAEITLTAEMVRNSDYEDIVEPVLDGRTDAAYYDLTLEKTITPTDGEPKTTTMTLSGESLQVIFVVPDEFQGQSDYNIINIYDGDAEELSDRDEVADTVTVKTRTFAACALVYNDKLYTVKFMNGSSEHSVIKDIEPNSTISLPRDPYRSGYSFRGWFTKAAGSGTELTAETKITKDLTVYAYFVKNSGSNTGGSSGGGSWGGNNNNNNNNGTGVTHKAYISGYEDGTFRPNNNISRAEASVILARVSSSFNENGAYSTSFTDVEEGSWYQKYIGYMASNNYVQGGEDGSFRPNASITRAEFVVMVSRYLGKSASGASSFSDCAGHWADGYINVLASAGYIGGYEDGTFHPDAPITRAEAVTILNRALGRTPDSSAISGGSTFSDVSETFWAYKDILEASREHESN